MCWQEDKDQVPYDCVELMKSWKKKGWGLKDKKQYMKWNMNMIKARMGCKGKKVCRVNDVSTLKGNSLMDV